MRRIFFLFFSILLVILSSCKNKDAEYDDISYYYNVPAIVGYDFTLNHTTLITPMETYLAPQLTRYFLTQIVDGDPLLLDFSINNDQEKYEGYIVLYELLYLTQLRKESSQATPNGESVAEGFNSPIENVLPYTFLKDSHYNHNVAFFGFVHANTVSASTRFVYEMTYDPDETAEIPTIYLRAKQTDAGIMPYEPFVYFYTFDLDNFLLERGKFNIMFKTGEDDGKELLEEWEGNPLNL